MSVQFGSVQKSKGMVHGPYSFYHLKEKYTFGHMNTKSKLQMFTVLE